jgi:hypothetical protein
MRRGVGRNVAVGGRAQRAPAQSNRSDFSQQVQISNSRELIARFFADLRRALRLTLPQAAYYLQVRAEVIEALETGQVEYLPPWPETARIVMTYASMAGVDGRPALNAMGALIAELSRMAATEQQIASYASQAGGHFMRAGSAIANGARWLPQQAVQQVRQRPQRALYALSLPLGLLLLMMHTSVFDVVAKPFGATVRWVSGYFQEHFAPVRDGMRYIEVDDPRSRRADKLQIGSGSY